MSEEFDRLALSAANGMSRRQVLRGIAVSMGAGVLATLFPQRAGAQQRECPPGNQFECGTGCCPAKQKGETFQCCQGLCCPKSTVKTCGLTVAQLIELGCTEVL